MRAKWREASFSKDFIGLYGLNQIQLNQVLDGLLEIAHGHSGSKRNTGNTFPAIQNAQDFCHITIEAGVVFRNFACTSKNTHFEAGAWFRHQHTWSDLSIGYLFLKIHAGFACPPSLARPQTAALPCQMATRLSPARPVAFRPCFAAGLAFNNRKKTSLRV